MDTSKYELFLQEKLLAYYPRIYPFSCSCCFVIDQLGLNDVWSHQGPMKQFYQQVEGQNPTFQRRSGQGRGQGQGKFYRLSR
jgi:hypothetical protein